MRRSRNTHDTTVLPEPAAPNSGGGLAAAPSSLAPGSFGAGSFGEPDAGAAAWRQPTAAQPGHHAQATPLAPEEVVLRVRRHGRHLTLPVLVLFVIAGGSGLVIGSLPEPWMNWLAAAAALVLFVFASIGPILGWLARRVVVTTRRVIVHHGFFVRHRTEVSLARVREVRSKQNPIQRLWGSGDIDLLVGTEATRIPDAPGMQALHSALQELAAVSYDQQLRAHAFGAPPQQ